MAQSQPIPATPAQALDPIEVIDAVLMKVHQDPARGWRTSDLVREFPDLNPMDVVLAVNRLHRSGGLERIAVATYRVPSAGPEVTARRNERMLWGDDTS